MNQFQKKYRYFPLSLFSLDETNVKDAEWELRIHTTKANERYFKGDDIPIPRDSLIFQGKIE